LPAAGPAYRLEMDAHFPAPRRCLRALLCLAGLIALPGAASAQETAAPAPVRWEMLRAGDLRVATVAYRLAVANRDLCRGAPAPQLGFVLHGVEQYRPADRREAARRFGLGAHPGVMAVVTGGSAQRAGLMPGDQLLSVNGRSLTAAAADAAPTRAFVEQAQAVLLEETAKGVAELRIMRGGVARDLVFTADMGCSASVELVPGEAVNAWADGSRIVVSEGLLARCATDDDLALVIGHELAHNLLHHGRHSAPTLLSLLPQSGAAAIRRDEEEADALAVRLAAAAAFNLKGAEAFLAGLLPKDEAALPATHPERERRLRLLRAAIAAAGG
jgi:hypothetical protein